jgi:hypothetical protein
MSLFLCVSAFDLARTLLLDNDDFFQKNSIDFCFLEFVKILFFFFDGIFSQTFFIKLQKYNFHSDIYVTVPRGTVGK